MSAEDWREVHEKITKNQLQGALKLAGEILDDRKFPAIIRWEDALPWFQIMEHALAAESGSLSLRLIEGFTVATKELDWEPEEINQFMSRIKVMVVSAWKRRLDESAVNLSRLGLVIAARHAEKTVPATDKLVTGFAGRCGSLAMARKNGEWLTAVRQGFCVWLLARPIGQAIEVLSVLTEWLYPMVKVDRPEWVEEIFQVIDILVEQGLWEKAESDGFLEEWRSATAIASLNPYSRMASMLVERLIKSAMDRRNPDYWQAVVRQAGTIFSLAITRYALVDGFPILRPIFDAGRLLMLEELKFGSGEETDGDLRQKALRLILFQGLQALELAARSELTSTAADMIEKMYGVWTADPEYIPYRRSIKKFCQLYLIYWSQIRRRQAKNREPLNRELVEPFMFSDEEWGKLDFLAG